MPPPARQQQSNREREKTLRLERACTRVSGYVCVARERGERGGALAAVILGPAFSAHGPRKNVVSPRQMAVVENTGKMSDRPQSLACVVTKWHGTGKGGGVSQRG